MQILPPPHLKLGLSFISKGNQQGFTLIELLIVVIIVGILSAIAVPNLLTQVGKARESEAKSLLGAVNRAQQVHFGENSDFATSFDALEMPSDQSGFFSQVNKTYYTYILGVSNTKGMTLASGKDNPKNGTRSYVAGIQYDTANRSFDTVLCRAKVAPDYGANFTITGHGVVTTSTSLRCDLNDTQPIK
jgi:type IV pilus assembly protein PilA